MSDLLPVVLEFPSYISNRPPKGIADCLCRLTPKQIVVVSGVVRDGPHNVRLGELPYRFLRASGRAITPTSWRLVAGEAQRLNTATLATLSK
jgi:hypothetical protein